MALCKYESLWKLMAEYKFCCNNESESKNLQCIICKNLMLDAVANNSCGCQYCYKCIMEYTAGENRFCPGGKEECKDHKVMFGINIVKSELLNRKISKLEVSCPNQSCEFIIELFEMENHLRLCTKQPMYCPYNSIGCNSGLINKEKVKTHLYDDMFNHGEMTIDSIETLKNELNVLRNELVKNVTDSKDKNNTLKVLEKEMKSRMQSELMIKEQLNIQSHKIDGLMIEKQNIENNFTMARKEIAILSEKLKIKEIEITNLLRNFSNNTDKQNVVTNEENQPTMDTTSECSNTSDVLHQQDYVHFVWLIDNCSTRVDTQLWSDSFYYKDYKLCLSMCINTYNDKVQLFCYIKRGDNDDDLAWPMEQEVTLSILDHDTMTPYKSETFQCEFTRPRYDKGDDFGSMSFIEYSAIKEMSSVLSDDLITVACDINHQQ